MIRLQLVIGCLALLTFLTSLNMADSVDDWSLFPGDGFVPTNTRHTHDPTIVHVGDTYFCFSTSGNGFGVMRSSPDLVHWTVIGPVMPETPLWLREKIPKHKSLWAPDVVKVGKGLRMYYCTSETFGGNTSYIGMAECEAFDPTKPTEGWVDRGMIIDSQGGRDHFNAIDPSVLTGDGGRLWMFFGSFYSGIYALELDPVTGLRLESPKSQPISVARNLDDPSHAVEAPSIVRRGDYFYLFNSYGLSSAGVRSTYSIGVGRSKSIEGPFVDRAGKPMIEGGRTNVLRASPPMFGPGHCMAFDDNGKWLLVHHYYDARHFWTGDKWGLPTLQVRELLWDDDGWPLPGRPIQPKEQNAKTHASPVGSWMHQVDFTEPSTVVLSDDGTTQNNAVRGTWTLDGTKLVLRWRKNETTQDVWTDTLIFSTDGNYYVGRNDGGVVIRGARLK